MKELDEDHYLNKDRWLLVKAILIAGMIQIAIILMTIQFAFLIKYLWEN